MHPLRPDFDFAHACRRPDPRSLSSRLLAVPSGSAAEQVESGSFSAAGRDLSLHLQIWDDGPVLPAFWKPASSRHRLRRGHVSPGDGAERGWNAAGLDTNPFAVNRARLNAPQATVYLGTLETSQPEGPYDLIVMNHVLEHLPRPVECLERCFGLLAPSGVLQIAVPNLHSFEAAAFGKSWRGLDVPRHLTHFRESTLVRLLEGCGYRAVSARPQLFPSSLSESLLLTLPRGLRRRLLGSAAARVLYVLSIIPAAVLNLFGNRAAIEIRASKPANA